MYSARAVAFSKKVKLTCFENVLKADLQGVNKKMDPPKSDCKHKLVLQIGLYCIV